MFPAPGQLSRLAHRWKQCLTCSLSICCHLCILRGLLEPFPTHAAQCNSSPGSCEQICLCGHTWEQFKRIFSAKRLGWASDNFFLKEDVLQPQVKATSIFWSVSQGRSMPSHIKKTKNTTNQTTNMCKILSFFFSVDEGPFFHLRTNLVHPPREGKPSPEHKPG